MSYRAAIVLLQGDRVALIERHRQGEHYFTFPGGHVEPDETPEQAALREAEEELGLRIAIKKLLAIAWWRGHPQYYYLVEARGGVFGSGHGEEMHHLHPEKGSYRPLWMSVEDLLHRPVLPRTLAERVAEWARAGWPEEVVVIPETDGGG